MMERLGNWGLRLVECFIPFLFVLIHSASAQQDFVSLACCAGSNYTDSSTNISWISDFNWFPDEKSCKNISTNTNTSTSTNIPISYINPSTERSRVFNISSGKKCYNLKINKEKEYLIRGTFLLGESSRSSFTRDYFFNVYVGVTQLSIVKYSQNPVWVEGIFITERNYIDFCLGKGNVQDPYISELELRPLHDLDYVQGFSSNVVLKLVTRVNVGNASSDTIRFPDDPSDRKWIPPPNPYPGAISISTLTVKITNYSGVLSAPQKVLQTALTHSNALVFLHNDLDKEPYDYRIIFYFLELDDTVISGQRLIDIYINGRKEEDSFNILANGSNFRPISFDVKAQESFNLTLVASDGSDLGPICNAYEILQVRPWVQETDQNDVEVILKVKDELLVSNKENDVLRTWSGDPCLPLPWEGLGCESINGSSLITKLDLSERKFEGLIPGNVTELANLKILNLGLNHFAGRIPPFPSSSMLISVDLSYNDLTELPESLASLPHLKILNIRGNPQLCKDLPPSSNNSGVSIEYEKCDAPGPTYLRGIVIGTVACGSFLLTIMVGVIYVCFCRHRFSPRGRSYEKEGLKMKLPKIDDVTIKSICVESFALKDIEVATDNYKTLIGEGGFGSVYRGTLTDGQDVAVKVRSATSTQGTREFDNEVNLLSTIRHENLVPLLGHCRENDQEILVYPFMSNGSLQDRLYGELSSRKTLDWATRLSIALGAARGLTYLHTYGGRCVIHRDVKSSNILLDDSMCAKVADFGFSKYAPQEGDSGASLEVRGTAGYLDPEYYSTHHLSAKSDVFSFGVVLLEIVSGREPLNIKRPRNEWSLVELAKQYLRESKIDDLVDPTIKGGYHAEAMWRVVEVALACIEPLSAFRPCMADIVRELEDSLIIENNASEYMRSIDSLGTSNHFSMAMDKKMALVATTPTPTEPSPLSHDLPHPEPR